MTVQLDGASAVVTGGASGLGAATAAHLAGLGAQVIIFDRDSRGGTESAGRIGGRFVPGDVTNSADVTAAMDVAEETGVLRVVVNCAGIGLPRRILNRNGAAHSLEDFQRVVQVNLVGTFNGLRLGAEAMARTQPDEQGQRGVIINTASIAGYDGQSGQVSYAASKGGIIAMTLPAARDLAQLGIRVCTVAPGMIDTPLLAGLPEDTVDGLLRDVLFPRRLGSGQEFAELVGHLVANRYMNAEVVRLDAGLRMGAR